MTRLEQLQQKGIRRLGTPRSGFRYRHADGRAISKADLARVNALALPPAWTDVFISRAARASLQAVGKDAAGRWQYRYHPAFVERQQQKKYRRLLHFARALPQLRAQIDRDLRRPELDREHVLGAILRVLATCFMRAGSQFYADEHGAYGVATLRKRHVQVKGDLVLFDYVGKSQKPQHRELRDRRVARVVRALLKDAPGRSLFQYRNGEGWVDVRRRHINEYLKEVMGERFSAKDFRTWAGTLICACALAREGFDPEESMTARKKKVVAAVKETAGRLGNTAAVCKSSYIYPSVLSSFDRGQVVSRFFSDVEELSRTRVHGLHGTERALLELLENSAKVASPPSPARTSARRGERQRRPRPAHRRTGRKWGRARSAAT